MDEHAIIDLANFILFLLEVGLLFTTSLENFYYNTLIHRIYWINKLNIFLFFTELFLPIIRFDYLMIVILSLRSLNVLLLIYIMYLYNKEDSLREEEEEEEEDEDEVNIREGAYGVYHALCII